MGTVKAIKPLGFHWETINPFIFCAYHQDDFPQGKANLGPDHKYLKNRLLGNDFTKKDGFRMYHGQKVPGFPYHPHAGFETITLVEEGFADHADSLGSCGRFGQGDVQWMTAGKGVLHSEMFPLVHQNKPNPLVLFQLWLNLPKASKQVNPHYKMLWHEEIPVVSIQQNQQTVGQLKLIAGQYYNTKALSPTPNSWAANPENEVQIWRITLQAGAEFVIPKAKAPKLNRQLFFYKGDTIDVESQSISSGHSLELSPSETIEITANNHTAEFLFLQAKPINEPVVQHGPFVANSSHEINTIIKNYQLTQFGGWPWPEAEFTHGPNPRRFAKYPDGTTEEKL
jgi:redox-sensitive bicupin YhaK (pirin superfamily)